MKALGMRRVEPHISGVYFALHRKNWYVVLLLVPYVYTLELPLFNYFISFYDIVHFLTRSLMLFSLFIRLCLVHSLL